jgi:hypothetical protein
VESEGWQMKQCRIAYIKKEKKQKIRPKKNHGLAALDLQYKNKAILAQGHSREFFLHMY